MKGVSLRPNQGLCVGTKVGVFFCKDRKMKELEQANTVLEKELEGEMTKHSSMSSHLQELNSKISTLQSQNGINDIQEMMLQKSIRNLEDKIAEMTPQFEKQNEAMSISQQENYQLQQELHKLTIKRGQQNAFIKRCQAEIKSEKLSRNKEKSLFSICKSLKQSCHNQDRNLKVLEDKLESKKKYLLILKKKQQKQQQKRLKEEKAKEIRKVQMQKTCGNIAKLSSRSIRSPLKQNEKSENTNSKNNLKNYNDLIRKKNLILSKK